jgi:choline-glycine betaine transporter
MGSKAIFFFYLIYVVFKYGHVKLGRQDEPPEFSTGAYFAMIFAAGVAVGLFVFGVAEPLWHQESHYYANAGYRSQDEIDMFALNMTVANWGISGWAPYLIVAVAMGLAGHRFNLPMTFRSCFYPILGQYTWGWIGDLIDGFAIVVTVAGVCTSLGLGAIQIVVGFQYLGWVKDDITQDEVSSVQNATIWVITVIATASVISGLNAGIRILSTIAFMLGMVLLFLVFVMDDTKYLLNLQVQEVGYYLQHSIFQLNFWTDAFGQIREGGGRAVDGAAAAAWWMDAWMIFYQAWWVSWSAFVGLFVARISRGRTVSEVIIYSLVAPVAYCIIWFSIWGGVGLRQARQGRELEALGGTLFNDTEHFLVPGSTNCYDVPQETLSQDGTVVFENHLLGVTPVCQFDSSQSNTAAFNVLYSFSFPDSFDTGFGPTLSVLFIISLAIYFATSSDSGSLIVDHLASNGRKNHHWIQRLFWAVTEGAVATALLSAGGEQALQAVQAASIVCGLPFCFMLCYLLQSIELFCREALIVGDGHDYRLSAQSTFSVPIYGGIFNNMEFLTSAGSVNPKRIELGMDKATTFHVVEFIKGVFVPFVSLHKVLSDAYPRNSLSNTAVTAAYTVCYYMWIGIFASLGSKEGLIGWGWLMFFACACILGSVRGGFRARYNVRSNILGDYMASLFFWPQVFTQMRQHCVELNLPQDHGDLPSEKEKKLDGSDSDEVAA